MPSGLIDRASFSGRFHAGRLLAACGLLIGLALAATMSWYIVTSRQAVIDDATREMRNDALMLAEQEDRQLLAADTVQRGLIDYMRGIGIESPEQFERVMSTREAYQTLKDRIGGLDYVSSLSLGDQQGRMLNYSLAWPPPRIAAPDRDFIRALMGPGAPESYVSQPSLSDVTGLWTIFLTRRFDAPDGRLIGFVICTIRIDYFEQFYARLPLTGGGAFAMYRRDGMLMARYPRADSNIGGSFAGTDTFRHLLAALDEGMIRIVSTIDGQERLVVPRAMPRFPLIIAVSDTVSTILGGWREQVRLLAATTVLLELAIVGTMLLGMRFLRGRERLLVAETARTRAEADLALAEEQKRASQTLHTQQARFDTALQNMLQGLLMVDHDGNLVLVNRRFHELFGLPPGIVTPGMSYDDLTGLISACGNVLPFDMAAVAERRRALIGQNSRATVVWELSDGRAFTVTHNPMEDGWLTTYEDNTGRRAAEARIAYLAWRDALTDLPNRALLRESLERAMMFARRGQMVALHCLDLDQFKTVNDTLGHPIGDGLLRAVAERLRNALRETDTVARLGGDEFAIVQTGIESPVDASGLANRILKLIEAPFEIEGHQIVIGTSIGIAFAPQDGRDADELMKNADLALYRAKADGRGVCRLFQAEMDAAMRARRNLELDLRQALSGGQLELFFQPQIDVRGRRIAGCEALLRWRHPSKGFIRPDQFIPLAEETGLIVPIGAWVLRQACATAAQWPDDLRVAVNLSAVQFRSPDLVDTVAAALREAGLAANRLELEITETVVLQDTDATLRILHQLRELGIQIAMDDFGTGYSSLSYLAKFPFDRIKIDQSFVRELGGQGDCIAIVRAVIALGRDLGMEITAEGVETKQQLDALERAGCGEIQGYLFSRPIPTAALADLLRSVRAIEDVWLPPDSDGLPRPGAVASATAAGAKVLETAGTTV